MKKETSFNNYLMEKLKDPELVYHFISEAIKEKDSSYLKIALNDIVRAYGVSEISKQTGICRQTIYKMFSKEGNPTHKHLISILDIFGLKLTVAKKDHCL